jgi:adenylylsulfate kinase-like enzyme
MKRLVVISGPIASGKTSLALGLAALVRAEGVRAAALDLDEFVVMVAGGWAGIARDDRLRAVDAAAAVVDRLMEQGCELVAVAGTTLSAYEAEALVGRMQASVEVVRVRLGVSLAEATRRAQGDRERVTTRDPARLAELFEKICWQSVPPADLEIETDGLSLDDVVRTVAGRVLAAY